MKKSRILLSTFLTGALVLAGCSSKTENSSSSNKTEQKKEKKQQDVVLKLEKNRYYVKLRLKLK